MNFWHRIKSGTIFIILLISSAACGQKKLNLQFVLQPGHSFVEGKWIIISPSIFPVPFQRKFTPALEAGMNIVLSFKGKAGSKVVFDDMYGSGFYLADKIAISMGIFYSLCGQNYKDMKQADITWSRKLGLQYLKIPFKFDFVKGKEDETQLIYTAGFYAGYLTWYKEQSSVVSPTTTTHIVTKGNTIISNYSATGTPGTSIQYELQGKPYNSIDYGASLGVGMQKKISPGLFLQLMFIWQKGFSDIKNKESQYSDGNNLYSYFGSNVNTSIPHKNSSLRFVIGLRKTFEWTTAPKTEQKRWRIFRLKE